MALIRHTNAPLLVNISDLSAGASIVKRKARLDFLNYQPTAKQVTINIIVMPFVRNEDGSYGDSLETNPLFRSFTKSFVAEMTHYCDASTGQVLCAVADEYNGAGGTLNSALAGKDYAYEFEFYDNLAFNSPVLINSLISARIQIADINGEFNTNG